MIFPKIEDFINIPYCLRENTSQAILAREDFLEASKFHKITGNCAGLSNARKNFFVVKTTLFFSELGI